MDSKDNKNDLDEDLAWSIGYALWRGPYRVKKQSLKGCQSIARDVVKHLHLSLWKFEKLPPTQQHCSGQTISDRNGEQKH